MNRFKNLKIRTKLLLSFFLVACVAGSIGFLGISSIRLLSEAQRMMYEKVTVPNGQLGEISILFQKAQIELRDMLRMKDPAERQKTIDFVKGQVRTVDSLTTLVEATLLTEKGRIVLNRFKEARKTYGQKRNEYLDLVQMDQIGVADSMLTHEVNPLVVHVEEAIDELIQIKTDVALETEQANTAAAGRALVSTILAIVLGMAMAVGFGYFNAKVIADPVRRLDDAAGRVASGDLSASVTIDTQDEIGSLGRNFNRMIDSIRRSSDELLVEKAGVEQKVAEGLQAAEENAAYLNTVSARLGWMIGCLAQGDFTARLDTDGYRPADQQLFDAFNAAVRNIRETIEQVSLAADAAASASTQISASTEELSSGAQEQSSQANEVAAAVEQMTRTIIENARSATSTSEMAHANGEVARQGSEVVRSTLEKMRQIAGVVSASVDTVNRLGLSSQQIGDIVSVINDIADQTNLLALNAAIEAARAGEQGRGFAVVADEVRKLAERTSNATKEIAGMIKGIQNETNEAVHAMQKGRAEVDEGMRLADRAGEALVQVVTGTERMVDMVNQIAAASEEQSTTSEEISRSVEAISLVSNESARGVTQIAQAAEGLNQLTANLRDLVSHFQVGESRSEAAPAPTGRSFASTPALLPSGDGHHRIPLLSVR